MNLSSSEWMIVILLAIGAAVLVIGLLGKIRWRLVVVGGILTVVAVYLLVQSVIDDGETTPSPTPSVAPSVAPATPVSSPSASTAP